MLIDTEIRPYVMELLLQLVYVHAELSKSGSQHLQVILSRLLEGILQSYFDFIKAIQCYSYYSWLQVRTCLFVDEEDAVKLIALTIPPSSYIVILSSRCEKVGSRASVHSDYPWEVQNESLGWNDRDVGRLSQQALRQRQGLFRLPYHFSLILDSLHTSYV